MSKIKFSNTSRINNKTIKPKTMKKTLSNRSIFITLGIIAGVLIILSSCRSPNQKQEDAAQSSEVKTATEAVIEELSGYPIPTSFEITKMIYEAGAAYYLNLSNDPGKAGDYITQKEKALNLGVYGTDLCYASTYMMKQETMHFLASSKTIIDELGISTPFNINYAERIENNLDDRDSLIIVVSESIHDTWKYLVKNKQDILARLVVSGSWIEGLYVTTNVALTAKDNTEFLEILAKQKNSLNKLVGLLEPVMDADDISEVFNGLVDLQKIFEGVGDSLNEAQLEQLSASVETLRSGIV